MGGRIPNAKLVELNTADHLIWLTDALNTMVNEIQDFVAEAVRFHDVARPLATDVTSHQVPRHRLPPIDRAESALGGGRVNRPMAGSR
jgi:hypothetical protein